MCQNPLRLFYFVVTFMSVASELTKQQDSAIAETFSSQPSFLTMQPSSTLYTYTQLTTILCWHKRAAFQQWAFGRSTAGNDVVATKNNILFFFFSFLFSVVYFSHGSAQKHFFRPCRPLYFAGSRALQVARECPRRR